MDFQYHAYIKRWKDGEESGCAAPDTVSEHIRRYFRELYNNQCSICGWSKVNPTTGKVPITIDHIDGNYRNCKESNLRFICYNCHALTPNFGSLNTTGNGRKRTLGR